MLPALLLPILAPLISELAPKLLVAVTGSERAETAATAIVPALAAAAGFPIRTEDDAARAVAAIHGDPQRYADAAQGLRSLQEAYLADLQNARARDLEVRRLGGGENRRADLLIVALVLLLVAGVAALIFVPDMAEEAKGLLVALGGGIAKSIYDVVAFEFGSSRGSKEKDAAITALARPAPDIGIPISPRPAPMAPVSEPGDRPRGLR